MKIQADRPDELLSSSHATGSERGRAARAEVAPPASERHMDRMDLSSDVRLVQDAVRATADAPEIRQDVVERARQRLLSGQIGADVERLADRLIDHMLA